MCVLSLVLSRFEARRDAEWPAVPRQQCHPSAERGVWVSVAWCASLCRLRGKEKVAVGCVDASGREMLAQPDLTLR